MEPKRTLHSGNLVRGRQKAFYKEASRCRSCLQWQEESFQILKIEDKEENLETMGKENHNIIKNSAGL